MVERMRQDAVIRRREIIGEAVKQLSTRRNCAVRSPLEADWRDARPPDHAYFGVDFGLIGVVVERDLGALATAVTALISHDPARCGCAHAGRGIDPSPSAKTIQPPECSTKNGLSLVLAFGITVTYFLSARPAAPAQSWRGAVKIARG